MSTSISPAEQNLRRLLPFARFMLGYFPLPLMRWLQSRGRLSLPQGVSAQPVSADGVACEWLIPDNASADQALIYVHGGGFVYGTSDQHRQMVGSLAQRTGLRVLMVDYRLAPEHPFPAALDDCVTAYRWLIRQGFSAQQIAIAGDSAGGHLTLTTLLKLHEDGDPLPAAAACLSPAADLTLREELIGRATDPVLHERALLSFRKAYIGSHDPSDPLLSPVYGDFHGLPPLLIHAGEDEFLRDDAARIAEQAKEAGVEVRMEVYPRMWHVWHLYFAHLPQAAQALDDIAGFIKAHLSVPTPAVRQS